MPVGILMSSHIVTSLVFSGSIQKPHFMLTCVAAMVHRLIFQTRSTEYSKTTAGSKSKFAFLASSSTNGLFENYIFLPTHSICPYKSILRRFFSAACLDNASTKLAARFSLVSKSIVRWRSTIVPVRES